MKLLKEFLGPESPLLYGVVGWLCDKRRQTVEGARSLAHVMVIVPTAQSGRNLRLALAREAERRGWGGVLPPRVVLPMQLVKPSAAERREATVAELAASFLKFVGLAVGRTGCAREGAGPGESIASRFPHLIHSDALADTKAQLSLFDQLSDIWRILAGGGLVMADVLASDAARKVLESAAGDEVSRWEELSDLEAAFFGFLHERGLSHPSENVRLAKSNPRQVDAEIDEVVLPALADPIRALKDVLQAQRPDLKVTVLLHADEKDAAKFDDYGRPIVAEWTGEGQPELAGFETGDIVLSSDTADMARRVVGDFPSVGGGLALPSLSLADDESFPEVSSAFLNAGYVIHNPERHPLSVSSLGRLVRSLADLYRPEPCGFAWKPFVSVMRSDDVLKALVAECSLVRADILKGVDFVQNRFLPQSLPLDCEFPTVAVSKYDQDAFAAFGTAAKELVAWVDAFRKDRALTDFLRQMLRKVFSYRPLSPADGDDEFREAALCVWQALDALESDVIAGLELPDAAYGAVVRRVLDAAAYSLEPDSADAIKTEGWLELPWSDAKKFALVGFHEGAVPDSLVGHPFVPDALRKALALTSNEDRLARDTWLFKELLDSHGPHAVRAYVAKTNNDGDICRPSRLLYLCPKKDFPKRVGALFGACDVEAERFPREVAERWRLRLPDAIALPSRDQRTPEGRLSASAIDQYVKCPFTYLLKYAMGMKPVEEKTELGFDDFGSLVHKVLEEYAKEQIARGDDQLTNADLVRSALDRIVKDVCRPYGEHPSVNVALQLGSLAGRIGLFAEIQAQWACEGWRIVERPEYPFLVQPFREEGDETWIKGSVDRIDYNPKYGYRIIDYKSWDKKSDVMKHIAKGGEAQRAFAERQHFPLMDDGRRLLTVQLPLYARCLAAADGRFCGQVADMCYLVLGEDEDNVCVFGSACPQGRFEVQKKNKVALVDLAPTALATARTAVRHIRENLFWPPGPGEEWKYDIKDLLVSSPEKDMGEELKERPEWLGKQLAKLEACK